MTMSMSKRLFLAAGLVAILALAFSAVTLTSRLTSAQGSDPTATVQSCDQQDEADDAAEAAIDAADTDAVENECGSQDEAQDTDDVQDEINESGGVED